MPVPWNCGMFAVCLRHVLVGMLLLWIDGCGLVFAEEQVADLADISSLLHDEARRTAFAAAARRLQASGYAVLEGFAEEAEVRSLKDSFRTRVEAWDVEATLARVKEESDRSAFHLESGNAASFFFDEDAREAMLEGAAPMPTTVAEKRAVMSKIGHTLHREDAVFRQFSHSEKVSELVYDFLNYRDPKVPQSQYIVKDARKMKDVRPDHDSAYLFTQPWQTVVAFWFALDDADESNGCLWVRPASHFEQVKQRLPRQVVGDTLSLEYVPLFPGVKPGDMWEDTELASGSASAEAAWAAGFRPVPVKAGDLVLLHGEVDHLSLRPRQIRPRDAWVLHIIEGPEAGTTWHPENWQQPPSRFSSLDMPARRGVQGDFIENLQVVLKRLFSERALQTQRFLDGKDQVELFLIAETEVLDGTTTVTWSDKDTDPCAKAKWLALLVNLLGMQELHIAEVGVNRGVHAQCTLEALRELGLKVSQYYAVDLWRQQDNYIDLCNHPNDYQAEYLRETIARVTEFWDVVRIFPMASTDAAAALLQRHARKVDVAFIDARHDYCGVAEDLHSWWPLVKPGGLLLGHDFWIDTAGNHSLCSNGSLIHGGVRRAVFEFAEEEGLQLFTFTLLDVWALLKPMPLWEPHARKGQLEGSPQPETKASSHMDNTGYRSETDRQAGNTESQERTARNNEADCDELFDAGSGDISLAQFLDGLQATLKQRQGKVSRGDLLSFARNPRFTVYFQLLLQDEVDPEQTMRRHLFGKCPLAFYAAHLVFAEITPEDHEVREHAGKALRLIEYAPWGLELTALEHLAQVAANRWGDIDATVPWLFQNLSCDENDDASKPSLHLGSLRTWSSLALEAGKAWPVRRSLRWPQGCRPWLAPNPVHSDMFLEDIYRCLLQRPVPWYLVDGVMKANTIAAGVLLEVVRTELSSRDLASWGEATPLFLEFGVGGGASADIIASRLTELRRAPSQGRSQTPEVSLNLHGFDSFFGLPEAWQPEYGQGHFSFAGVAPSLIRKNIKLIPGWYNATVEAFLIGLRASPTDFWANLVHIDCDLYSSTVQVLLPLQREGLLRKGTILVFDELLDYPGFEDHELRALFEFLQHSAHEVEVLAGPWKRPERAPRPLAERDWLGFQGAVALKLLS
ncbi:unnamed protein product [Polarella glacialis]|uniref:Class I SAM-dependent methyltransferase n=1 Tax=Polarella glacialis TaxID=89957 RepID=A0A813GBW5_POLGL|nr:unnamed protein product [Polarella glacialis]